MGVDVVLVQVQQKGTSPRRRRLTRVESYADTDDRFVQLCSGSGLPMLERADPVRTVILTSEEMDQLIRELDLLKERVNSPWQTAILAEVRRMALICSSEPSFELHLDGD